MPSEAVDQDQLENGERYSVGATVRATVACQNIQLP